MQYISPEFVTVTVNDGTAALGERATFELPLFVTPTKVISSIQSYTSSAAMTQAGFASSSPAVQFANGVFNGKNPPAFIKVAPLTFADTDVVVQDGFEVGDKVTVILNNLGTSQVISHTVVQDDTTETVATALQGLLDVVEGITATVSASTVTVELAAASKLSIGFGDFTTTTDTTTDDITTALGSIVDQDNNWFFLSSSLHDTVDQIKLATFANGKDVDKFYVYSTQDPKAEDKTDTTNIGAQLKTLGFDYVTGMFDIQADSIFPEGGIIGYIAGIDPGRRHTLNAATLPSIPTRHYTVSQQEALVTHNISLYSTYKGSPWFWEGYTPSGKFTDLARFKLWVKARTQEGLALRIKWASDRGVSFSFSQKDLYVLEDAIRNEVINPAVIGGTIANYVTRDSEGKEIDLRPIITFPRRGAIPASDLASRTLNGVLVQVVYEPSIHRIDVVVDIELTRTAQ